MIPGDDTGIPPAAILVEEVPPSVLPFEEDMPKVVEELAPPRVRWGAVLGMLAFVGLLILLLCGAVIGALWLLAEPIAEGLKQFKVQQEQFAVNRGPFIPEPENVPRGMDPTLAMILLGRNPPTDQEIEVLRQGAQDFAQRAKAATEAAHHRAAMDDWTNLGRIQHRLRAWRDAAAAYAHAYEAAGEVLEGQHADREVQLSHAKSALQAAECYRRGRRPKEAEHCAQQAIGLGQIAIDQIGGTNEYRELLSRAHALLTLLYQQQNRLADAEKHEALALQHCKTLAEENAGLARYRAQYGSVLLLQGERLTANGQPEQAQRCFRQAARELAHARSIGQFVDEFQLWYGFALLRSGQIEQAVKAVQWMENGRPHIHSDTLFGMARIQAQASVAADVRELRRQEYRRTAMHLLERLASLEYFRDIEEFRQLKEEPDLEPLRRTEEFQRLLKDMESRLRPRPLIET